MTDKEGQIAETHSLSAGLDYPGSSPLHGLLKDSGRARYTNASDKEALASASLSEALVYRALPESFNNPCKGLEPG